MLARLRCLRHFTAARSFASCQALAYESHGVPKDVLKLQDWRVDDVGEQDVLLDMLAVRARCWRTLPWSNSKSLPPPHLLAQPDARISGHIADGASCAHPLLQAPINPSDINQVCHSSAEPAAPVCCYASIAASD